MHSRISAASFYIRLETTGPVTLLPDAAAVPLPFSFLIYRRTALVTSLLISAYIYAI